MIWLARRLLAWLTPVQAVYYGPWTPTAWRRIVLYEHGVSPENQIGEVVWQQCDLCRVGIFNKVGVIAPRQRRGLGRRLVLWAVGQAPGYTWVTTGRSPDGDRLFGAIAREAGLEFPATACICAHISAGTGPAPAGAAPAGVSLDDL